ncbi:ankyrin repeat domain-containing protein [Endozoicomonas sp. YOMI1]|uniref:ankyrin repeat domain-containing protein n=1 Tax=Endozoicomonas sp. YOMI1 TaxID=2828739 RepID=UPI002147A83C|nr:ankyrin repeat domain-containing protein [Endozoicomonas sp. YOMI1]
MISSAAQFGELHVQAPPGKDIRCPICLDSFHGREVAAVVVKTQCGHYFDLECISKVLDDQLVLSRSCSVCRQNPLPLVRVAGARIYEDSPYCEDLPLQACKTGDVETLRTLLKLDNDIARRTFRSAVTGEKLYLLHIVAQNGHLHCLQALIDAGANLNVTRASGVNTLYIAAQSFNNACLQPLIDFGADLNAARITGSTPLHVAVWVNNIAGLQILINAGANLNAARTSGATALYMAAQQGYLACLQALIDGGADLNAARTMDGATPLFVAAQNGNLACLQALIDAGADLNAARTSDGATPLSIAARKNKQACYRALRNAGADRNAAGLRQRTETVKRKQV